MSLLTTIAKAPIGSDHSEAQEQSHKPTEPPRPAPTVNEGDTHEVSQQNTLKYQLAALAFTKSHKQTNLAQAVLEVREVMNETERASQNILKACEQIEKLTEKLKLSVDQDDQTELQSLSDRLTDIYESCYFHDITSQRLNKILNMFNFMETTIDTMSNDWGGLEAMQHYAPVTSHNNNENLLNGPATAESNQAISQDDIDKLFN